MNAPDIRSDPAMIRIVAIVENIFRLRGFPGPCSELWDIAEVAYLTGGTAGAREVQAALLANQAVETAGAK
jgi:hypothetical protein